jgi:hypothetical protein
MLTCSLLALCRFVANKYLRVQSLHAVDQKVEWLYAFDIHCNSFFPLFVVLYVLQFFLLPLVLGSGFLSTIIANSMYAFAFSYYFYVTFLGYNGTFFFIFFIIDLLRRLLLHHHLHVLF